MATRGEVPDAARKEREDTPAGWASRRPEVRRWWAALMPGSGATIAASAPIGRLSPTLADVRLRRYPTNYAHHVSEIAVSRYPTPPVVRGADVTAKAGLVLMLIVALAFPDLSHMRDKAAGMRAIAYPLLAFTVPFVWVLFWKERASFPWLADLLVTISCFTDILGNQMNLYDTLIWFDDWMHFMNTGLLAAAVLLLTLHRTTGFAAVLERALAFGATAALAWEIGEYFAFLRFSPERRNGYADTLGDLTLGTLGAILAAVVIHTLWRQGHLRSTAPQLDTERARS